jgi:hypothetical protein
MDSTEEKEKIETPKKPIVERSNCGCNPPCIKKNNNSSKFLNFDEMYENRNMEFVEIQKKS